MFWCYGKILPAAKYIAYQSSRERVTSPALTQSAKRLMFIVPVTGCILAGWRSSHAMAIVVLLTLCLAATSLILAFSSGNFSLSKNTPSKKPYWKGDQG